MQDNNANVQQVPMASFEAAQARHNHLIVTLIICWTVTIIVLGFALICSMSYTEEAVEEIVTTETITQDSGDGGANHYIGGDLNGEANYNENGQTDQEND